MDLSNEMSQAPIAGTAAPDVLEPYRRWAGVLFAIVSVVVIAASAAVITRSSGQSAAILLASAFLTVTTLLAVIVDLDRGRWWAVQAIAPLCYVFIVVGVLRALIALTQNNVTIPLEAIGALMVLSREHGRDNLPELIEPDRRNVTLAVVAIVAAALLPYAA
jgi:cytochrome bd-type quinol oxidase subunit 2